MRVSESARPQILVVDDQESLVRTLELVLKASGYDVLGVSTPEEWAAWRVELHRFDAALIDLHLGWDPKIPMGGHEILKEIKSRCPEMPVLITTGVGGPEHALAAMRHGAFDVITKPVAGADLIARLRDAIEETLDAHMGPAASKERRASERNFHGLRSRSPLMFQVFERIAKVARRSEPVVITGETGSGKELVGEAVHAESGRKGPLERINCAAIQAQLLESELFGHERGAFTDAHAPRQGLFRRAQGGTVLLDEIAEMDPNMQAKLLRAVERQEVQPLGSDRTIRVDVRILAATNKDLPSAVREARFRQDLYFRLDTLRIELPPLRERVEDILLLASHFARLASAGVSSSRRRRVRFSKEAKFAMLNHRWEGNVRELERAVQRAIAIHGSEGWILPEHLELSDSGTMVGARCGVSDGYVRRPGPVKEVTAELVHKALMACSWSATDAAELLGISRQALHKRIRALGLTSARSSRSAAI